MAFSFYVNMHFIPFYVLLLICAAVLALFSYRRIRHELRTAWIILFIILRTFLFFLLFSALFSVVLQLRFKTHEKPLISILLDSSGSMEEIEDDSTRFARAKQYLNRKLLPHIGNQAEITLSLFSDDLYERGDTMEINTSSTMIGTALERIAARPRIPSAVFLLSDGRNTSGADPLTVAERIPFPVHAVKIGTTKSMNNLSIQGLRVNPIVYKNDSVPVSVVLSNSGPERKNVAITLSRKGITVSRTRIPVIGESMEIPMELAFVPAHEGIQNYEVNVALLEEETNTEDNRRNFTVRVIEKRKKVVLISHQLNWDYRFLREFLNAQNDIDLRCFARIGNEYFIMQDGKDTKKGAIDRETVLSADIIILINPAGIPQKLYDDIAKSVAEDGKGLLIIGNKLPVFSSFKDTYPLVVSPGTGTGDAIPVLTKQGRNSALFGIRGVEPAAFPPLSNPLHVRMPKSSATVLLETKATTGKDAIPLFAYIVYHRGKIAALPAENLWHWKTLPLATGSNLMLYDEFLNNILQWLIPRKEAERFVLYADRAKVLWGEPLTVSAALYDETMNPLEGGSIVLHIEKESTSVSELPMRDVGAGNYERELGGLEPGHYTAWAETKFPESIRTRPSFTFEVEEREIETLNTEPDHLLLRGIAEVTGGTCLETTDPIADIELRPSLSDIKKQYHFAEGYAPFIIIAALFLAELLLRKRKGLR